MKEVAAKEGGIKKKSRAGESNGWRRKEDARLAKRRGPRTRSLVKKADCLGIKMTKFSRVWATLLT